MKISVFDTISESMPRTDPESLQVVRVDLSAGLRDQLRQSDVENAVEKPGIVLLMLLISSASYLDFYARPVPTRIRDY